MKTSELEKKLVAWLKKQVRQAGAEGIIVGLSGGIDSAVVAACARKACGSNCLGVIMPCHSLPEDEKVARAVARNTGIKTKKVDLSSAYDALTTLLPKKARDLDRANIKPRLRMITLYYLAGINNYLVAGTGNKTELTIGYFTKYGDGGVDLLPLGSLVKSEVADLARQLKLPASVITRKPSAGLWAGQTDEDEIGLSYDVLDKLVSGKTAGMPRQAVDKVKKMKAVSEHKRKPLPVFKK